ncbi:hypothetical protein G7K_5569-t1 [Saitoella complicata NRRL Y-17804]|uniref:GH16 domain-containing protein n=2 Tax=Saitoella complicata (strain BCRC 22490 / CBS 7301 / JCM 7358 / NBRC 10748 / NRRL Y-17804) TaxID=698492 RepID=A0A0E9NNR6_SAICN|nr:hypothetical protein G7K_5569-t1 [Saitoella complicata NRRL Y-17804]
MNHEDDTRPSVDSFKSADAEEIPQNIAIQSRLTYALPTPRHHSPASSLNTNEWPQSPTSPGSGARTPASRRSRPLTVTRSSTRNSFSSNASGGLAIRPKILTGAGARESATSSMTFKPPMFRQHFVTTLVEGDPDKSEWAKETRDRWRLIQAFPWIGFVLAAAVAGFLAWYGWQSVPTNTYSLVLEDDFSNGLDTSIWNHEVQLSGFGNGGFDMTTTSENNSFVKDGMLHIVPTLTSDIYGDAAISNGYTLNLTGNGCTSDIDSDCAVISNSSTGVVLPPIQSARLNTKGKYSIKYGKVEVVAKIPSGNWMWPAIWMMPSDDVYGAWPRSGEIDIMEAKGNTPGKDVAGRDYVTSSLHWGPSSDYDAYLKTTAVVQQLHGDFSGGFNTYGLEWTPDYLFVYVNSRLRQGLSLRFNKESFYNRGEFPKYDWKNSTLLDDPWSDSTSNAAPFDQDFYLILNVAVGGTNGYFSDNMKNKPWGDSTTTARRDFWAAKDEWYPTWPAVEDRGMVVKSVKMYQLTESQKVYLY